ncbi:MAG TPA: AbrB/MazE/SpoVT family DNA-binding domain-containing protein [Dehalococcoidia bacterium]|nr:AbrB/MazE/SpoVT family DNA-binding domain-containing protein [Dehalococcoidia bacterium]
MRISVREKRQVTLPASVCKELGIEPGDLLDATVDEGALVIRPARKAALDALKELQRAIKESGVTLSDLLEGGQQVRKEIFRESYPELAEKYDL